MDRLVLSSSGYETALEGMSIRCTLPAGDGIRMKFLLIFCAQIVNSITIDLTQTPHRKNFMQISFPSEVLGHSF